MAKNLSRVEDILDATIDGTEYAGSPLSRVEQKLLELKQMISEGISPADTATIRQAVTDYLAAHPIEGVDEETVNALIADYIDEHPIDADTSDIWKAQGKLGAKNLLFYPYHIIDKTIVSNGVNFTLDDTDNLGQFVVDGTYVGSGYRYASRDIFRYVKYVNWLKAGTYILSTGVDLTQPNAQYICVIFRLFDRPNNVYYVNASTLMNKTEAEFSITDEQINALRNGELELNIRVYVNIPSSVQTDVTFDNIVVKPMIRLATDPDDTWQPYAKTNKQLTDDVKALKALPIGKGSGENSIIEGNVQNNIASGVNSHAEGSATQALAGQAHAEGSGVKAQGSVSHAEGYLTVASGSASHAEGYRATASGTNAHSEGQDTYAAGYNAHAQNKGTIARYSQTAIGEFNAPQGSVSSKQDTDYALIIGNGTDADHRSNALAVKWDGTVVFADGSEMNTAPTGDNGGDSAELESILTNYAKRGAAVNLVNFNLALGYFDGLEKNDTTAGVEYYVIAPNHFGDYETGDYGAIFISATNNVAAAASRFYLANSTWDTLPVGHYKLISAYEIPNPGVRLAVARVDSNVETVLATYDNQSDGSVEFAITANGNNNFARIRVYIEVDSGAEISGQEIFPVIVPAAIDIDVATPNMYVANNSKLTDDSVEYRSRINNHESRIQSLEHNGGSGSGTPGADGKSAYQIAVDNGFSGTESEWLASLKGDPGTPAEPVNAQTIPKVFLTGDTSGMSKENPKDLFLEYKDGSKSFNATANVKWQGSSSLSYPKKNFTIKLYKDATKAEKKKVDVGFGNQSKYVLKANYIDHSHARNIVCARLWGDIVASRTNQAEIPTELLSSPNNGAVDGYPIKLYLNGDYQGIYTWNVPKDGWMMGMDSDNPNHAILVAEGNRGTNYATQFKRTTNFKEDTDGEWTIEFPDADQFSDALKTSFNNLLTFVSTSSDEDFVANLSNYANVQSLIDYYIFAYLICGLDILGKNLLMCTFDGTHWFASAYDLDSTFGLWWNGSKFVSATYRCPEDYQENDSLLWQRLEKLFTDAIKERYSVLRSGPMSVTNVICRFEEFTDLISKDLYDEDGTVYSGIPSKTTNNIRQIRNYYVNRCAYVDGEMQTLGIVTLSGITATKTTQQYNVGDTVDTSDITVVANYSDGTSNDVTSSAVIDTSAVDTTTDGTYQITISYTEDDVTVTTTCTVTVGEGSQEPVVDDDASFTPTLTCVHNQALNPGDIGDGSTYRDYLVPKTNNHSFVTTTANSMPIYTDETRATIAGYAIPVPATAQKVKLSYSNAKTSTFIRFVDNDLQFIGDEVSFLQTQNASYEFSNLSKHPKWINIVGSGSSQSSAASLVLTFE